MRCHWLTVDDFGNVVYLDEMGSLTIDAAFEFYEKQDSASA